jgi:hypothetical protein
VVPCGCGRPSRRRPEYGRRRARDMWVVAMPAPDRGDRSRSGSCLRLIGCDGVSVLVQEHDQHPRLLALVSADSPVLRSWLNCGPCFRALERFLTRCAHHELVRHGAGTERRIDHGNWRGVSELRPGDGSAERRTVVSRRLPDQHPGLVAALLRRFQGAGHRGCRVHFASGRAAACRHKLTASPQRTEAPD